jgi:Cu2+-exporting ATPase
MRERIIPAGESTPIVRSVGARVIGGAINGNRALKIEIGRTGKDSFLSQVIALLKGAQQRRSRTQDLAARAASV